MSLDQIVVFQALASFLIGSIPFAVIAMIGSGIDIRKVGSGNPGFNNVLRVSKSRAVVALLGDMGKGLAPALLFHDAAGDPAAYGWLYGFAAVFGHCYSPFLKFNGGKGIATSAGVMLGLYPMWAGAALAFFVVIRVLGSRKTWPEAGAIASLATWLFFALLTYFYVDMLAFRNALLMTLFLTWRHRTNIRNLFG